MKRPFDPDDRSVQAKASLSGGSSGNAPPKPKAVPLPYQVPKPAPADPVRSSTSSSGLVKSVQPSQQGAAILASLPALPKFVHPAPNQGLAAPPSPRRRISSPLRGLGGLAPPGPSTGVSASSRAGSTATAQSIPGAVPKVCPTGGLLVGSNPKFASRQIPKGISVNASSSALCREKLLETLENLQEVSELWTALQGSQHRNAHVSRLLSGYASATILRYLSAFQRFMQTAAIMEVALPGITAIALADVTVTLSLARSSDPEQGSGSVISVKSIRWAASHLQITSLSEAAWDPLIASFYQNRVPKDKKEACPLTLCQMTQLERRLLMAQASTSEVMTLGSILSLHGPR